MKSIKDQLILFLLLFPFFAAAQNGPFDNACIIVVNPVDLKTGKFIEDLTISLQDSSGTILKNLDDSLLIFKKNPGKTDPGWAPHNHMAIRYSFAKDYYIRTLNCSIKNIEEDVYLVVEDQSSTRQTHYKKIVLKFDMGYLYSLLENVGNWTVIAKLKETPAPKEPFNKRIVIGLSPDESSSGESR
jgi:hypothetical protein